MTGLRHRHCICHLTAGGPLRAESLHHVELSDFQGFHVSKLSSDVRDPCIMVDQIAKGKTTHGKMQCGRATRHKDARLCCVGALSFCLMVRFCVTGEFASVSVEEWKDNRKWFDMKLPTGAQADNEREMRNDAHADHTKKVLGRLGLTRAKILHLGRNLGAKTLNLLQEEEEAALDSLGNWVQTVRRTCHS